MSGAQIIQAERKRQQRDEGWSARHDDSHKRGELTIAAAVYALPKETRQLSILGRSLGDLLWPWDWRWYKPADRYGGAENEQRIRELVKAGALIAAEIDRLRRSASPAQPSREGET